MIVRPPRPSRIRTGSLVAPRRIRSPAGSLQLLLLLSRRLAASAMASTDPPAAATATTTSASAIAAAPSPWISGKRVLITGAGRGIGLALARICDGHGAAGVALASRTRPELDEAAASLPSSRGQRRPRRDNNGDDGRSLPSPLVLTVDVTSPEQVASMVDEIVEAWGGLDLLVNNAGAAQPAKGGFEALDSADLSRILQTNVISVHLVTSEVVRKAMRPDDGAGGGGACQQIVNISSRAGKVGLPTYSFYGTSKFALEGLTACMAEELKVRGGRIRVNSLSPGMVDTASFPKARDRPGVRTAESVEDAFLALLGSGLTGHYLHADELDAARARGLPDAAAIKPINEPPFDPK